MIAARLALLLVLAAAAPVHAYVGIQTASGLPVRWADGAFPVSYVIHAAGSDDVADLSDDLAIRRAFGAWDALPGAALSFVEITTPEQKLRTDWPSNDLHLVRFQEVSDPFLFPPGSGVVAATPLQYKASTGKLLDADILLNGAGMTFAAGLDGSAFDIRAVVTHEVGHVLGIGHSPLATATMTPYVTKGAFHPRTLSPDDVGAAEALYPAAIRGSITGVVRRAGSGVPVAGAGVWARFAGNGQVLTSTVTGPDGSYELTGLVTGNYAVVAAPIETPVIADDLDAETDFQPASFEPITVVAALPSPAPDLLVPPEASLTIVGPIAPLMARRGESTTLTLDVVGGLAGAPTLLVGDGGVGFAVDAASVSADGSSLSFDVTPGADTPLGPYDLGVATAVATALAPGFLEVLPPAPALTGVSAACGSEDGGADLLVTGSGFATGAEVTFGAAAAAPPSVLDDGLLTVPAPAAGPGPADLVVMTAGGEEARLEDAYLYLPGAPPQVDSVFPGAGSASGGTLVTLVGTGFEGGVVVRIGGVRAAIVLLAAPGLARVVAPALPPGIHDISVSRADCGELVDVQIGAYTAVASADPKITGLSPTLLVHTGGETVALSGQDFVPGAVVEMFTDPLTGTGGTLAPTTFVDEGLLTFVSPGGPIGPATVVVRHPNGSAAVSSATIVPLVDHKDRVKGALLEPGSQDVVYLDGLAGSRLTLTLRRVAGSALRPAITVLDPDGIAIASTDPQDPAFDFQVASSGNKLAVLRKLPLVATGRHTLLLYGLSGTTGSYKLKVKERLGKASQFLQLPKGVSYGPGPLEMDLLAKAGSRVSGKLVAKDGLVARLDALVDPAGVTRLWTDADGNLAGDPTLAAAVNVASDGSRLRFQKLVLDTFGTWELVIGAADETSGPLVGKLRIKAPASKDVFASP